MRIGFIALSGLRAANPELQRLGLTLPGFIERKEVIASLPSLGLLTLAGMTPSKYESEYIELQEFQNGDDLPGEFDLVAISSFTAQINRAYELADNYRQQGTKVVLGGLHVTALPEEASAHADTLVLGEGEVHWPELLRDFSQGRLKPLYDARGKSFDLRDSPIPRYELLEIERYNRLTVQTQRGCPFRCEFCASSIRLSPKFKTKPIERVISEILRVKSFWDKPFIELADDNTFANKSHAKKLVGALAKQKIKWFTETDISVADDDDLLLLLQDSGCRQLLIGLESPSPRALNAIELKGNWKKRRAEMYLESINKIQAKGISVNGCFILGMDGTDQSSFSNVLDFAKDSGLSEVQITIQTPFPGTELYERYRKSGRLLEQSFWDRRTLFDVTFEPQNMTVAELEEGFRALMKALYCEDLVKWRKAHFASLARETRAA